MTTDTQALNTATAIMAILHDAVLNPNPGGLVQLKAKIQVAVRDGMAGIPDPATIRLHSVWLDELREILALEDTARYDTIVPAIKDLLGERDQLATRNNQLHAEDVRLRSENQNLQGKNHDLRGDVGTFQQQAAATSQRCSEAVKERDDLSTELDKLRADRDDLINQNTELSSIVQMVQDQLEMEVTSDNPIADEAFIHAALRAQRGKLTLQQQDVLLSIGTEWMPLKGLNILKFWLSNQPKEQ